MRLRLRLFFIFVLLAVYLPAESLMPGGDFESDAHGWHLVEDTSVAAEDHNRFLRLSSPEPDRMVMLYHDVAIPADARALKLAWRWRVTDLQIGKRPWFDARIILETRDASGAKTSIQPEPVYNNTGTRGWEQKDASFRVPAETVSLKLMPTLFQVARGTLDLDDFTLVVIASSVIDEADRLREADAHFREVPREVAHLVQWPAELRAQGNRLVTPAGVPVLLRGVNASGLGSSVADPQPLKSTQVAIDDWGSNCVRLPVNDEFWFGRSGYQTDGGHAYRDLVDQCVMIAANRGAYLVLDLHHYRAPRAEHIEFWKDAAARYKNHPAVLFDLFNEPYDITWAAWRDGGLVDEKTGGRSVGMQALLDAVRSTGARNLVIAGGIDWALDLSGIVEGYALEDKNGNGVMYSWHVYNWHRDWERSVLLAAARYPIYVGEFGADVKRMEFVPANDQEDPYTWMPDILGFIQRHDLNWSACAFHPYATPVLVSDWRYTPTPFFGQFIKDALAGKQFNQTRVR